MGKEMTQTSLDYDAVVAGHICIDIQPDLSHMQLDSPTAFLLPGKLRIVGEAATSTGGSVSNTGLSLIKLGMRTALMGKVGEDAFGDLVPLMLKENGGDASGLIVDRNVSTSYTIVLTAAGCDRMFLHNPGANDTFGAEDINYDLVQKVKLFHFGYPPVLKRTYENNGRELEAIFRRVHELGVATSLDMALPDPQDDSGKVDWPAILERVVPYVDIFLPSVEELLFMLERDRYMERCAGEHGDVLRLLSGDDLHRLSGTLFDMGAKIVAIKCGGRGFYARTASPDALKQIPKAPPADPVAFANRELWHPTFHIDGQPSTTGAGDSSIAGFLASYLRGYCLEDCMIRATATGSCNVTKPDPLSGVTSWDELTAMLEAGWETDPLEVAGEGWRKDDPAPNFWTRLTA